MDEPEIQPDAGTGTEQAEEATPAGEITETPADASADGDASGDDGHSESHEAAGSKVPYGRFYKVNEQRKALELENARLKEQIQASKPKEVKAPVSLESRIKKVLKPAPSNLGTLEQLELYGLETLEAHAPEIVERIIQEKLGMSLDQAAATLGHSTVTTREQIRSKYETAAKARGLDPKNPQLQDALGLMMDSGRYRSFEEAMDTFRPAQTAVRPIVKPNGTGRGAEVDTINLDAASRIRALPRTKEEAMKLAAQGKRVDTASVTEILKALQE